MLDVDLASLYGVSTKRLNEQLKGNKDRLPGDFMFRPTAEEKAEVVTKCDHLRKLKIFFRPAFCVHRARGGDGPQRFEQLSGGSASVQVVRAFVRLRQIFKRRTRNWSQD